MFLVNTPENTRLFRKLSGFSLISYFLEQASPDHLTVSIIEILFKLYEELSWNSNWQDSLIRCLLYNFRLWVFAHDHVQEWLFERLYVHMVENTSKVRQCVGVCTFFDALYFLYDFSSDKAEVDSEFEKKWSKFFGSKNGHSESYKNKYGLSETVNMNMISVENEKLKSSTDTNEETRNGDSEVQRDGRAPCLTETKLLFKKVRKRLFDLLLLLFSEGTGPQPEDVSALVGYMLKVGSAQAKAEAIAFMCTLLGGKTTGVKSVEKDIVPTVLLGLAHNQNFYAVTSLLDHPHPAVKLNCFLVCCQVMQRMTVVSTFPIIASTDAVRTCKATCVRVLFLSVLVINISYLYFLCLRIYVKSVLTYH